jgi:UDP-N-acetyl-D-glucosamine dehydrogenase
MLVAALADTPDRFSNVRKGKGRPVKTLERSAAEPVANVELRERLARREAVVGLIGLGYAGLPLAVAFAEAGFPVVGVDLRRDRVESLSAGHSYVEDVAGERLAPLVASGSLRASSEYAALADADVITICVPTPLSRTKTPDTSAIAGAIGALEPWLRPGQLIMLESTSYPGTTEEIVRPVIEARGFTVGKDMFLAFAPERVNPGDTHFGTRNTTKIIGGVTPACRDLATALYSTIVDDVVPVSSPVVAEMAKLLENTFRQINVAFANEMALICEQLGVDVWEVIDAAATKPFGFMPFYPGPGLGGPCIPVVPHYLAWKLKALGYDTRFIALADEINNSMPAHVVNLVADALNDEAKPLRGSRVLVLGITYKPNVADTRESPPLAVLDRLLDKGAHVEYHDPFVPEIAVNGRSLASVMIDEATVRDADCVVVATNHSSYDWQWIIEHAQLIVDTRNVTAKLPATSRAQCARIVKLGAPSVDHPRGI